MLDKRYQRGFSPERLATNSEPRVRRDEKGYYIQSLSENTKVYFDDYYQFLEAAYGRAMDARVELDQKIETTSAENVETLAYYSAKGVVVDLVMRTIRRFYADGSNLGVIMTPWCFGTVVLEKAEVYRDRLSRGEVQDPNVKKYPYDIVLYIDEIHRSVLLALFDFPEKAFQMRWQYSEILRRYSRILTDITGRLQSVLSTVKSFGA